MHGSTRSRSISIVAAVCVLNLFCLAAHAQIRFDLPSQPLAQALTTVGSLANLNIYFDPPLVKGLKAPALDAELTPDDALARLLAGTGLRVIRVNQSTVRVIAESELKRAQSAHTQDTGEVYAPANLHLAYAGTRPEAVDGDVVDRRSGESAGNQANKSRESNEESDRESDREYKVTTLEEVVVTAQKRTERLIDTPQSVSVVSSADLAKLGAVQFSDFANTVPGLNFFTAGAGYTQISLRGVTAGFDSGSTVAVYVDEVPYGSSSDFANGAQTALDVGLFSLDRIEVLRGPQGTLYGASSMGGLIKYVTKQPDTSRFGGDAQAGVSGTEYGGVNYNVAAAVNFPVLSDKIAVRASGFESHDGGYVDNIALGQKDANRSDIYGGRLDVLFTPTEALTIRVGGFLQDISRDGESTVNYTFAGVPAYGKLDQYHPFAEPFDQKFRLVSSTVTYDFGPTTLTSISSYQTNHTQVFYDVTAYYAPALSAYGLGDYSAVGDPLDLTTKKFTQEVRLASNGTKRLEWVVGGFYTHESSGNTQSFVAKNLAGQFGTYDLFFDAEPSTYKEIAGFGDLTYHLTSAFDVSGGLRYSRNDQVFDTHQSGLFGTSDLSNSSSETNVTYLANARYHFSDNATGYLRYATGYHPGGPNFVGRDPSTGLPLGPETFKAEKLRSYEAGFKAETADRRFSVDVDGYYIDWTDVQVAAGAGIIVNAPGAHIWGSELALTARPTSSFTATGAFAYQNARTSEADTDLGAAKGERLPNVPRFTAALNGDYEFSHAGLRPTIGAALRYVSDRTAAFDNAIQNPSVTFLQYRLPAYTAVDLRTGIALSSVNLQLYVRNVFDERGQLSAITYRGPQPWVAVLQPRTIGISATTSF